MFSCHIVKSNVLIRQNIDLCIILNIKHLTSMIVIVFLSKHLRYPQYV